MRRQLRQQQYTLELLRVEQLLRPVQGARQVQHSLLSEQGLGRKTARPPRQPQAAHLRQPSLAVREEPQWENVEPQQRQQQQQTFVRLPSSPQQPVKRTAGGQGPLIRQGHTQQQQHVEALAGKQPGLPQRPKGPAGASLQPGRRLHSPVPTAQDPLSPLPTNQAPGPAAPLLPSPPPDPPTPPTQPTTTVSQPAWGLRHLRQLIACPDARSVKLFGAKGDMETDDSAALASAAGKVNFLYFPPGGYRIASSVSLDKPLLIGWGAYFWVEEGCVLTLTGQPRHWSASAAMFAGPGRVVLAGRGVEVYPDWFKNWGDDDADALQKATDSCGTSCTIMVTRNYYINKAWQVQPSIGVFSTYAGILWPGASRTSKTGLNPDGVVVMPGVYSSPLIFTGIRSFSGAGLQVLGGAASVQIQAGHISYCGDGLLFAPGLGDEPLIRDVAVSHISANMHSVVFEATEPAQTLEGVVVRANFNVMGGFEDPDSPSSAVLFRGVPPTLNNTQVIWQAIDPAQFQNKTQFTMLQSTAEGTVTSLRFRCETWAGGFEAPGKLIDGNFSYLSAMIFTAGPLDPSLMYRIDGEHNRVSIGTVGAPDVIYQLPPDSLNATHKFRAPIMGQSFFALAPVDAIWPPGQVRTFFFESMFAATAGARLRCMPYRANNLGITCAGFERQGRYKSTNLQQLYPPPPPVYQLYRDDADGSAERPLPPEPPAPIDGTYQLFGELHTTEDGLPPLQGQQLYSVNGDGTVDFKGELLQLHRELLAGFLELLRVLTDRPSLYARQVESLGLLLRNFQHLLNAARPYQARATLAHMLSQEVDERRQAAQELRKAREAAGQALQGGADRLAAALAQVQGVLHRAASLPGAPSQECAAMALPELMDTS
ncbi:hypothetical protein N2152v2_005542 [Parachlorella kessleri]